MICDPQFAKDLDNFLLEKRRSYRTVTSPWPCWHMQDSSPFGSRVKKLLKG